MSKEETRTVNGSCRYCGQIKMITLTEDEWLEKIKETNQKANEIADVLATEQCHGNRLRNRGEEKRMTRDEALKKMQAVKSYMTSGNPIWSVTEIGEAFDMAIEALERTEQQWIPCTSTKRPKDMEEVMVTIDDGYRRYTDTDEFVNGQYWYHDDKQVVAWKPLDEPWRGEEHGTTL